ncbi:hypothetical protein [Embleya sp. NPDC020630]|uniref:hypothetical protein n=1 Tax=Embleya sp. NPDC020630 TaxID=3363979 RepID=UPI0037BC81DC
MAADVALDSAGRCRHPVRVRPVRKDMDAPDVVLPQARRPPGDRGPDHFWAPPAEPARCVSRLFGRLTTT